MRRVPLIISVAVLLLTLGLRANRITDLGIQADEGAYLVIIEGLLQGQLPYRDLFLNHPPIMFWLMSGIFQLTGAHLFVGRWVVQLVSVMIVATLMVCGKLALPGQNRRWGGMIAGALFMVSPLAIFWSRFILLEHFETLFAVMSIVLILLAVRKSNAYYYLLAGIMTGLAILVKISGLILIPVISISLLIIYWQKWEKLFKFFIVWVLGGIIAVGGTTFILVVQGILDDFINYLSGADRLAPFTNIQAKLAAYVDWHDGWILLLLAGLGTVFILWKRHRTLFLGLLWAAFEVAALMLPERLAFSYGGFSHYALPVIAALSLLGGTGIAWGNQQMKRSRSLRWGWVILILIILGLSVWPKWTVRFNEVVYQTEYPQPIAQEIQIGEAVQVVTNEDDAILVFGNSGFYHWAKRPLSTQFYHLPAYFSGSPLQSEVEKELTTQLTDGSLNALLVSRMHMEDRLWPELSAAVWQNWDPVKLFSYPYQRDLFLFLPKSTAQIPDTLLVSFAANVVLKSLIVDVYEDEAVLVDLRWLATEPIMSDYIVFVHLLTEDGTLVSQSDVVPQMGFRPTTSWAPQELVTDKHWLQLPEQFSPEDLQLSIGMYRADNGERLSLLGDGVESGGDSFTISLSDID